MNMEIVKTFSLIKVAICTQFLDIVPSMCGFKYLRRPVVKCLVWSKFISEKRFSNRIVVRSTSG